MTTNTDTKTSLAIKVPAIKAEKTRKILLEKNLLRKDLKIHSQEQHVFLPIINPDKKQKKELISHGKLVEKNFNVNKHKEKTDYKEKIDLPDDLQELLPTSFDVIGDIATIKLPDELLPYKKMIGDALLNTHKNLKTICLSKGVTGELRVPDLEIIAGENNTSTTHKEYGLRFDVDVAKTYFSPRLAEERKRVANQSQSDEIIVDMFAGVAPFSIMIASYGNPRRIYAIDKNTVAARLARRNISRNKVADIVEFLHADAQEAVEKLRNQGVSADRVIMNLPFSAHEFFTDALGIIASNGGIIHYYDILEENEIDERIRLLKKKAEKQGKSLRIKEVNKIKTYSPRQLYIGFDIEVKK